MKTPNRTRHLLTAATIAAGFTIALSAGTAAAAVDPVDEITDVEVVCDAADPSTVDAAYFVDFNSNTLTFLIEFDDGTPQPCSGEFYAYSQWPIIPAHEATRDAAVMWTNWSQQGSASIVLPFDCGGFGALSLDGVSLVTVPATPCEEDHGPDGGDNGDGEEFDDAGQPEGGLPETGSTSLSLLLAAAAATSLGLGARRLARRPV